MVGTYATASVTGTYASRADAEPTQFIGLGSLCKYNAQVNEGAAFGKDVPYPFRYLFDNSDAISLRVYLTEPARGYESFTLTVGLPENKFVPEAVYTDEGYFEAEAGVDYTQTGSFSYSFKPGELFHDIRIAPIERTQWFVERLLHVRLEQSNVEGALVLPYASANLVSIASHRTPPKLTVDAPSGAVGSTFDVDFDLDAACIDPVTVYYSWSDTDVTASDSANNSGSLTIPAGQQSKTVEFSHTAGSGVTRTITIDHERETVVAAKEQTWVDADAGTYSVARDIHIDENLVRRGNDIFRHGTTGQNTDKAYSTADGIRPQMSGFPSLSLVDGAGEINHNLLGSGQSTTAVPTNTVNDPITGRAMAYMVIADNANGVPYVRQEFPAAYGGGPISAFELLRWSRVAFRREFFTGDEVDLNTEYSRVGYRIRVRDRNTGVVFKFRKPGTDCWGDQTLATATMVFSANPSAGDTFSLTDAAGTTHNFEYVASGATGKQITIGATVQDTLNSLSAKVRASGFGCSLGAGQATIEQSAVANVAASDTAITYSTTSYLSTAPTYFVTPTIVDGGGRDMRPTSVGGTNEQYYYDSTTGVEVWFWHQYNQWRQPPDYVSNGGTAPVSDDAWGTYYGVTRDDAGLTLWYIHYMPYETDTDELYRYGTTGQTGGLTDTLVDEGLAVWNYNGYQSESTGS